MESHYQALARVYRPKRFQEVIGQEAIITTLQNAHRQNRLAHAYLFSGPRGTGKTTIARLLAKLLNCPKQEEEPCNECSSCKEIGRGSSLDVLEIDGASNRGIDDVRQINETVGYASSGAYKIYIIDEVHMLTKEAFNALLKTLEEPPPKVKFFFATTEPHKIPATIISRCQRFELRRISEEDIVAKLQREMKDLKATIDEAALQLIAKAARGSLRDAESLLDQVLSFGANTEGGVSEVLGLAPSSLFAKLDQAIASGDLQVPFALAEELEQKGTNLSQFFTALIEHYRQQLITALQQSSTDKDHLLNLLDDLLETQERLKTAPVKRIVIEMALTRVVRCKQKLPLDALVQRLTDLEARLTSKPKPTPPPSPKKNSSRYDTVLRFAAVELEGRMQK